MDINSIGQGAGALAVAYLAKDGVQKLLGPTADYIGVGLKDFTQKRAQNIEKIFTKAIQKLGKNIDSPGNVPPKVLKAVIEGGSYTDNELCVEYLGGILASSRTEDGRDDRGARIANIVDLMSTYQLRAHYLIYSTVRNMFKGKGLLMNMNGRPKMQLFIPYDDFFAAMDFSEKELDQIGTIMSHIFFGLQRDGLIETHFQYGNLEAMLELVPKAKSGGVLFSPSVLGVELFTSALGKGNKNEDFIFDDNFDPQVDGFPAGSRKTQWQQNQINLTIDRTVAEILNKYSFRINRRKYEW